MAAIRWVLFCIVAGGFFLIALNGDVYNLTSPADLPFHTLLRKAYSIVAFAIVGFSFVWALQLPRRSIIPVSAIAIAIFSGAIEIGQESVGSHEGLQSQIADVMCGAIGGWAGGLFALTKSWVRAR
ncbi:MAG: hypothetical protein NVSMB5_23710 [Candidatus Velthaea sp.]